MGGDEIPCWPNQLFDETTGTCTSWQSVTEKLGDSLEVKCPEFDASMMLPEDKDENANPQLFFVSSTVLLSVFVPSGSPHLCISCSLILFQCGSSTFNAKSVCEPCPGGSRLECSDTTHNCFAGVTGCPVSSLVDSSPSEPEPVPNPPPETPQPVTPQPIPESVPNPTPSPTVPAPVTNDEGGLTNDEYYHGSLRSSLYCGYSWDLVTKTCDMAHPCPSVRNTSVYTNLIYFGL